MTEQIPQFPVVHGNVYPDGTAHINFAGRDIPLNPADIGDARAQITSYAIAVARDVLHRPVRLTTVDPEGRWFLAAHPDGRVTDLAPPRTVKRSRRRKTSVVDIAVPSAPSTPAMPPVPASVQSATVPASVQSATVPASVPAPPAMDADERAAAATHWQPSDLPSEAELTAVVDRHTTASSPTLVLEFDTGATVRIVGAAIVGRRPVNATGAMLAVHQVDDPTRNLSRTHFLIAWSGQTPAIIDAHSANGTVLEREGAPELTAPADQAVPLQNGDVLRFGDLRCRVSITVAHAREVSA